MKAVLEFDLNDFDDKIAHLRAVKATELALVLWQLVYNSKKGIEYFIEGEEMKGKKLSNYEVLDEVYKRLYELLEENHIIIDELVI